MPTRKRQPIELTATSTMLYDSVDTYHPLGFEDNSVRMNNHEDLNDFSSQSIISAMDQFVKAVNNMNETIMVPCRLLDIEVGSQKTTRKVPKLLKSGGGDPYSYYSVLNSVKNDLIWGATSDDDDDSTKDTVALQTQTSVNNTRWTDQESDSKQDPMRRHSAMSMISVCSTTSEGDSENGSESTEEDDRSSESEEGTGTAATGTTTTAAATATATTVTETLRTHLFGLHSCLKNLTETATFITDCYQEEVNI